jgi:hypothetical protein
MFDITFSYMLVILHLVIPYEGYLKKKIRSQ